MKHLAVAISIWTVALAPAAGSTPPTMSFEDVRAGMRGSGRTVFAGTTVETFDVEILGKLPNVGPHQNLILARCSGGPLGETGVLSGMSGSPVTIDGKLVGAIAYSWGFSTEAIAGITPIAEMLEVARREPAETRAAGGFARDWRAALADAGRMRGLWEETLAGLGRRPGAALAARPTLAVSGVGPAGLAAIEDELALAGWSAQQGAGGGGEPGGARPALEPGSAIGLKLVRGDVEMAATGTVTWIDGDRLLAFGHPLFGLGRVDLPLTAARVETLLPSLLQSARIAVPTAEVGALREDRAAAVLGVLGAEPRMIPVRLQLDVDGVTRPYSFDVADDPLLAPVLLYLTLQGILGGSERTVGDLTLRLAEGSVIKMSDDRDVEIDNVFRGPRAADFATATPAYILHLLMNNAWTSPRIVGVNLRLEYAAQPRSVRVRRVVPDRHRVSAGETVELAIDVEPFRGAVRTVRASVRLPDDLPTGELKLLVAGAPTIQRDERLDEPILPRDLEQLIELINRLRRNDRVYVVATSDEPGLLLGGANVSDLPPSARLVLGRPGGRGERAVIPVTRLLEESVSAGEFVEGAVHVSLEVLPR